MGRPSEYSEEVAERIIAALSAGTPLAEICRDEDLPTRRTVYNWMAADEGFSSRIAHAREDGFDHIAAEALRIADTPVEGIVEKTGKDGVEVTRADMLGHRKLQVETRLKLLAKWDPKRYGDRIAQEISGPDGGPIQQQAVRSKEEAEVFAAMMAKADKDLG